MSPSLRVRLVAVVCAAMGIVAGCATSSSSARRGGGTGNEALDFYPLLPGWGWAYEIERDGSRVLAPYAVIERSNDTAVVKNGDQRIAYAVLPDGIARREGSAVGDYVLRPPVRKGTTWPVSAGEATIVDGPKTVTVASGSYSDCFTVEEVRREPDRVTRTTYCRGTGPIDIEVRVFDPFKKSFETMAHAKLLAVTRPDDER